MDDLFSHNQDCYMDICGEVGEQQFKVINFRKCLSKFSLNCNVQYESVGGGGD